MCLILQNSVRGKLKHTLPLNQKKNLLLLNTISNPTVVTLSPSGISEIFICKFFLYRVYSDPKEFFRKTSNHKAP